MPDNDDIYLICMHNDSDLNRINDLRNQLALSQKNLKYKLSIIVVDATKPESASTVEDDGLFEDFESIWEEQK